MICKNLHISLKLKIDFMFLNIFIGYMKYSMSIFWIGDMFFEMKLYICLYI